MALNSLLVDPKRVWQGSWRWYDETMLDCCTPLDVIRIKGITLSQLACVARCNSAHTVMHYGNSITVEEFRRDVIMISSLSNVRAVSTKSDNDNVHAVSTKSDNDNVHAVSTKSDNDNVHAVSTKSDNDNVHAVSTKSDNDNVHAVSTKSDNDNVRAVSTKSNNDSTAENNNDNSDEPKSSRSVMIVSYNRRVLNQTGAGHFSPIAGYHEGKDMVLILDVARFKYPPHWVPLKLLYEAMQGVDEDTGKCRGYLLLRASAEMTERCCKEVCRSSIVDCCGAQIEPGVIESCTESFF
eukprot:CAMPEP_0119054200 /NCGR_PEP_ID=MMETSP1177-20130426/74913_1 /TAXON_ID=2985 /ORGANISM="Ochromonas sp, Strain CCMP1899" /LENGTH=294 /DNA_ID=CAMNT_0007034361 /DNA_START=202 /DNA_END=1086 /DNA_ORIENTATION=-